MDQDTVPTVTDLSTIYAAQIVDEQSQRWQTLLSRFKSLYNKPAEHISRSPGRVNLIGEHVDYSLYNVVPMAVEQDVLVAIAATAESSDTRTTIELANIDSD